MKTHKVKKQREEQIWSGSPGRSGRTRRRGRNATTLQRYPKLNNSDGFYYDNVYTTVKMQRSHNSYPYRYKVQNDGPYKNMELLYDDSYYSQWDSDGYAAHGSDFPLVTIIGDDSSLTSGISSISVGTPGVGAVGGSGTIKLKTSGLNSCVAWVLANQYGAYMEHILVTGDEFKVNETDLAAQVKSVHDTFAAKTGANATHVYLHYSDSHPAYRDRSPSWWGELCPLGCKFTVTKGDGVFDYTAPTSNKTRKIWSAAGIKLKYDS